MRRFERDSDESDSGDESVSFKRSKRFRRGSRNTEDETDCKKQGERVSASSARPDRNGVIKYASSSASSTNGAYAPKQSSPTENTNSKARQKVLAVRPDAVETFQKMGLNVVAAEPTREQMSENNNSPKTGNSDYSVITYKSSATEIMKTMGFSKTKGMGQFMTEREISASTLEKLQAVLNEADIVADEKSLDLTSEVQVEEEIKWIPPVLLEQPFSHMLLSKWRKVGPPKNTIRDEKNFIDPVVLKQLLALKQCFNVLNDHQYFQLRSRGNVFEKTGKGPFVSRAGLKMASLDAALSFSLTQPTTNSAEKHSFLGPNDLFYFADVCAGPGGFSEYVLFRKKWGAKGFGMTLKGKLDFDVKSFFMGSPESFEPFYGPENNGDVYNPKNVAAFIDYVQKSTEGRGVHLMMADGGFDVSNKELQEPSSAQILVSQCLLALLCVRPGGMFICKLFDTLTPFTQGLLYLMYHSFELVGIHKPNTSRPANSERYLICKWRAQRTEEVAAYLASIHEIMWEWQCSGNSTETFLEIVPLTELKQSKNFYEYMLESNNRIARQQIDALKRMVIFSRNPKLEDPRQEAVKKKCFEYWNVPEKGNRIIKLSDPPPRTPSALTRKLLGPQVSEEFLKSDEFTLLDHNLEAFIRSPFDWRIVVIEAHTRDNNRGFYLSMGGGRTYRYDKDSGWLCIVDQLELCKDTLVFGEFVDEIHGTKPFQKVVKTFHIIDAMVLGGTDVRNLHYTTRHEVCVKFAKSMNKPTRPDLCAIRAKTPVRMENIADVFEKLENKVVTGCGSSAHLVCPVDHTDETLPFIRPIGIMFLKITKDPWTMDLSRTSNRKYYFNLKSGLSSYEMVPESVSEFMYTMRNRIVWWWDKELKNILSTQDVTNEERPIAVGPNSLNPHTLLRYVGGEWRLNRNMVMRRLSSSSNSQGSC